MNYTGITRADLRMLAFVSTLAAVSTSSGTERVVVPFATCGGVSTAGAYTGRLDVTFSGRGIITPIVVVISTCATDADCDDRNPCTLDRCQPTGACSSLDRTGACDDGNACTVDDTCERGVCTGYASCLNPAFPLLPPVEPSTSPATQYG